MSHYLILTTLFAATLSSAGAATIHIDFGTPATATKESNINYSTEGVRPLIFANLVTSAGLSSNISLTVDSAAGKFWNKTSSIAFTNAAALADVTATMGNLPANTLGTFQTNGQGTYSSTYKFQGLTLGETATLYFFGSTDPTATGGILPTSFALSGTSNGVFSYASSTGSGFQSNIPTTALNGEMMLLKWTGTITSNTVTLSSTGDSRFGAAYIGLSTNPVPIPEPGTAACGLLALGSLLLRRRRA